MASRQHSSYGDYVHIPRNNDMDHIPGQYGLPLIGTTVDLYTDALKFAQDRYQRYGHISKMLTAGERSVVVLGPDLAQQVLVDAKREYSSKMGYPRVEKFFGSNVVTEDFEHHRHQRRIMQTAFKFDTLKTYQSELNTIFDRAMTQWEADLGKTIPFFQHIKDLLLEMAAKIFIGENEHGDHIRKLNEAFLNCSNGVLYVVPYAIPGNTVDKGLKGRKVLEDYLYPLLTKKRAEEGRDMLSHFCREKDEDGNFYDDTEVVSQMLFLMFAAHDTTTAALTHTIYYLARNPEAKQKLYEECKSMAKDSLSYEDLESMTYTQQVFHEVLRFRPSVPIIPRRTIREVEMGNYKVPAHTMLMVFVCFNHFMEEYWTEPTKFDPDRFSPARAEHKRHPFLFHPFGGGAHKCIGMHFSLMVYRTFLHKFMLKYDFESRHKKDPHMLTIPIPKPKDDMPVALSLR